MHGKIFRSKYKDVSAITLESFALRGQFLPEHGGKMASLMCKKTGREFLVQAENSEYKRLNYDGDYCAAECSGFDDMFPTIDRCFCGSYPWNGAEMPDHGEVCALPWDYSIEDDCLRMSVHGIRFPYRLEKEIHFESDNVLTSKYKATNLSDFDMDFIWAAHAMINAEDGGEILVPYKGEQDATCIFSCDEGLGKYGDKMTWPETRRKDGKLQKLNFTVPGSEKENNFKFYFDNKMTDGGCAYKYRDGTTLAMSFPPEQVPCLGIWVNEGSFKGYHNIALEPCTGSYDRPDIAKLHGQNSVLGAKGEYAWFLKFSVHQAEGGLV